MTSSRASLLEHAVTSILPDIQARVCESNRVQDERTLWSLLSCCILSSQVPYDLAVAASIEIDRRGLLTEPNAEVGQITEALNGPLEVRGLVRRYRFPVGRARQLAATHSVIKSVGGLCSLLSSAKDAAEMRDWLSLNAPGVGPKQASMFLRNAGISYDLAVIDRHVLHYMNAVGLNGGTPMAVSTLSSYRRSESSLSAYARARSCRVGVLDWAIWIVVRAARTTFGQERLF